MACDLPALAELDINPLLADAQGVLALDARVRVRRPVAGEPSRLARAALSARRSRRRWSSRGAELAGAADPSRGRRAAGGVLRERVARATCGCVSSWRGARCRHSELARYCQIDYEREMTFVALASGGDGVPAWPAKCARCAIRTTTRPSSRCRWRPPGSARGWARALLAKLIRYLRERGTQEVIGAVPGGKRGDGRVGARHGVRSRAGGRDGIVAMRLVLNAEPRCLKSCVLRE